jgi:hypothetical protein
MKRIANIGYWFLLTSLFVESMSLGHLTSADYVLGRVFGFKGAYPWSFWFEVLSGLFVCLLGLFTTSTVLLHRPWSKQLIAVFCSVAIVFILARALSAQSSDWWFALEFCVLPVAVLGYLTFSWRGSRLDAHKVGQLS